MEIHGVVSLRLTIVFTSGVESADSQKFDKLKHYVSRYSDIRPSDINNDSPVVVSQQTLETTLACLGISADRVRSGSYSSGKFATLVGCQVAGSTDQHHSSKRSIIDTSKWTTAADELQPVIDRIKSSIQRLNHQWQILDDAQKRLKRLAASTLDEVDWDDPVIRIQSELDLFDSEEADP
ncbi:uncharacterized protein CTRU02_212524 [Colletotrichum truncatum]|uniref:Uncharacterized protein n=1 Tax=Colletotrichum truncatum TaxID=5467 RepID=A0ACC3YPB0_COLTU|nr:uncharacterized protein CTRU02_05663 [Colletotrichum truncatum]KAF6794106.1 hypothetical protein CTRU02_05663 [Colletotrichum truncatum]